MFKFMIIDWAGNVKFDGKLWDTFEDAEAFLCEHLDDDYDESRGEFEIVAVVDDSAKNRGES